MKRLTAVLVLLLLGTSIAAAQTPTPLGGSLVIAGGGTLPEVVYRTFMERAGGAKARLVLIPTASEQADAADLEPFIEPWRKYEPESLVVLHTCDRKQANDPSFVEPLREATAVWISGGLQRRLAEAYVETEVERELHALVARGGVVGGTSAGAAIMSRTMIAGGISEPEIATGLGLLPQVVIDQHFLWRNRMNRLLEAVRRHPDCAGLGIDEATAVVVQGRQLEAIGDSYVVAYWAASSQRQPKFQVLRSGDQLDWVAMVRAAKARCDSPFPPAEFAVPEVTSGSLMIVGGGAMNPSFWQRFVELAGGPDAAIVVVPSADASGNAETPVTALRRAGAKKVSVVHAVTPAEADRPEVLEALAEVGGIWFGGGRQWRLVDAFEGTRALELMHDVLARGGVIGGSSAGATIQGEYLVRGSPLGNQEMVAEGYERGFAFLPGTAIDQHFSQRQRQGDMEGLKRAMPQVWGIGIDEATALVVRRQEAEVLGRGKVFFYPPHSDGPKVLSAGEKFHFVAP